MLSSRTVNRKVTLLALTAALYAASTFPACASAQERRGAPGGIRIAVFNLEATDVPDLTGPSLTDQVVTIISTIEGVQLVSREELSKVADEHKIALSGLVDASSAARLGKFVNAQYILVGRAIKIGQSLYAVLKLISVETTLQTTVAVKASAADGWSAALERLEQQLTEKIQHLEMPPAAGSEKPLEQLKAKLKPLAKQSFLVAVSEEHVDRPLRDPAAQMAIVQRLRALGLTVVVPNDPVPGWKQQLLETGKYGEQKIDYLVEGEGVSGQATVLQGLTSCRARVELRIVKVPGRAVTATDRGVGAAVDLVEALAAKAALEDAGAEAIDATLIRLVSESSKSVKPAKNE